jgi:hypothetical protein
MASFEDLFAGYGMSPGLGGGYGGYGDSGYGGGIGGMRNSLVGLGMGLLSGPGQIGFGNAMKGYEQGAVVDQRGRDRQAQLFAQAREHALSRDLQRERMDQQEQHFQKGYDLQREQFEQGKLPKPHIFSKPGAYDEEGNQAQDFYMFTPDAKGNGTIRKLQPEMAQGLVGAGVPFTENTPQQFTEGMPDSENVEDRRNQTPQYQQPPPMQRTRPPNVQGPGIKKYYEEGGKKQADLDAANKERAQAGEQLDKTLDQMEKQVKDPKFAQGSGPYRGEAQQRPLIPETGWSMLDPHRAIQEYAPEMLGGLPKATLSHMNQVRQNQKMLETQFAQLLYKGQGQVSDMERKAIREMVGEIGQARDGEDAANRLKQLRRLTRDWRALKGEIDARIGDKGEGGEKGGVSREEAEAELRRRGVLK